MKSLKSTVYVTFPLAATAVTFDSATVTGSPAILTLSSLKLSAFKPVEVSITLNFVNAFPLASYFEAICVLTEKFTRCPLLTNLSFASFTTL